MNVKWASDQILILDAQYISQNYGSVHYGKDLSTTDHVWDANNINVCFQLFRNTTQNPITNGAISFLTLSSVLIMPAKSIYLLTFSFPSLTTLWSWSIATSIGCHVCGDLYDGVISIPIWVTVCGNGVTSL